MPNLTNSRNNVFSRCHRSNIAENICILGCAKYTIRKKLSFFCQIVKTRDQITEVKPNIYSRAMINNSSENDSAVENGILCQFRLEILLVCIRLNLFSQQEFGKQFSEALVGDNLVQRDAIAKEEDDGPDHDSGYREY